MQELPCLLRLRALHKISSRGHGKPCPYVNSLLMGSYKISQVTRWYEWWVYYCPLSI
ncbi:hypothetical protein IAD21_05932 [Abditibacteriota bacterium]|nr:hypothetical protein IAD21_05932 [Abditibacteriota bacterium]